MKESGDTKPRYDKLLMHHYVNMEMIKLGDSKYRKKVRKPVFNLIKSERSCEIMR